MMIHMADQDIPDRQHRKRIIAGGSESIQLYFVKRAKSSSMNDVPLWIPIILPLSFEAFDVSHTGSHQNLGAVFCLSRKAKAAVSKHPFRVDHVLEYFLDGPFARGIAVNPFCRGDAIKKTKQRRCLFFH
jgi:hypothetical protein